MLRCDPAFKLACGRLPDSGRDLCSQPTLSRLENASGLKDVIRLAYALVDQWMASYAMAPSRVTLDIDDTCDVAHGHQQLSRLARCIPDRRDPSRIAHTDRRHDPGPGVRDLLRSATPKRRSAVDSRIPAVQGKKVQPRLMAAGFLRTAG